MIIYSEITNEKYTSVEECLKAEDAYKAEQEAKKREEALKAAEKEQRKEELVDAFHAWMDAKEHFYELKDKFVADYGNIKINICTNIFLIYNRKRGRFDYVARRD